MTADDLVRGSRVGKWNAGAVKIRRDYFPFGLDVPCMGGRCGVPGDGYLDNLDDTRQRFTGKERDTESGLDYFGARYFSGPQGRFTSTDPLLGSAHLADPQTWNRYTYGLNNPLRNTDPLGLWDWDVSAGGSYTDEELQARSRDRNLSRRERNSARDALAFRVRFR